MSLVRPVRSAAVAGIAGKATARFPPPRVDDQNDRSRRRGDRRRRRCLSGGVCARPADRHAAWVRLAIFAVAVAACAWCRSTLHRWIWCHRCAGSNGPAGQPALSQPGRSNVGRHRTGAQRVRAAPLAGVVRGGDRASGRRGQPAQIWPTAVPRPRHRLWAAGGMLARWPCAVLAGGCFRPRPPTPGRGLLSPGKRCRVTRSPQSRCCAERLVVPHGEPFRCRCALLDDSPWQPATGTAELDHQPPVAAGSGRRRATSFRCRGRSMPRAVAACASAMRGSGRDRADDAARADGDRGRGRSCPSISTGPSRCSATSAAARFRWSAAARSSFAATANRARWPARRSTAVDQQPRGYGDRQRAARASTSRASWNSAGRTNSAWQGSSLSPSRSSPATTKPRRSPARICRGSESCSIGNAGIQAAGPGRFRRQGGRASSGKGSKARPWPGRPRASGCWRPARATGKAGVHRDVLRQTLEIEPQPLAVRLFVEDYFPGRAGSIRRPTCCIVLSAEQHFVWLTEQLSKWHRQSLEVRDREMQLHQANQQLRLLLGRRAGPARNAPPDRGPIRGRTGQRPPAQRHWSGSGEELMRQAMRNPEFGVGHLEKWAEMLQILKDISANRMPNVADLLKQSAQAQVAANSRQPSRRPRPGRSRSRPRRQPARTPPRAKPPADAAARSSTPNRRSSRPTRIAPPAEPTQEASRTHRSACR